MKYCPNCAAPVSSIIPDGDNRLRDVCTQCHSVHYQNPKIIAGCIVEYEQKILLCKRAIEPRLGLWTIPAGFLENNETTAEGASRETYEESKAQVDQLELFCLYNIPHISQIYMIYRARLKVPEYASTEESSEVDLYLEQDIPWDSIAFPVVTAALEHYFSQRRNGHFHLIIDEIDRRKP